MGTVQDLSPGQEYKMHWIFFSVVLVCASAIELEDIANVRKGSEGTDISNNRKPKLFFVSSASTTKTIETDTACYVSSANGFTGACSRRRRRPFLSEGMDNVPEFQPSLVESGMDDTVSEGRQGKFLLYWLTTTSTSTSTKFTKTATVLSVLCTPSGASFC